MDSDSQRKEVAEPNFFSNLVKNIEYDTDKKIESQPIIINNNDKKNDEMIQGRQVLHIDNYPYHMYWNGCINFYRL